MAVRVATLLAVVATVMVATALPAAAHNELRSSNPAAGATLDTAPAAVALTFAQPLIHGQTTVTILGPDGASAAAGPAQVSGAVVTVPFKPTTAGAYTVGYKVIADDGDVTDNSLKFTLTAAAIPAPTTTATTTTTTATTTTAAPTTPSQPAPATAADTSSTTWWPYVVIGLAVILIAAVAIIFLRRRRGTPDQ